MKAVRNEDGSVSSAAAFSYADAICECCSAVSHMRSDARLKDKECLRRTKLPCWAAPEEPSEPLEQSRLEIVPLGSLPIDPPIGCEAKTNYATTPQSLAKIFVVASVLSTLDAAWFQSYAYRRVVARRIWMVLVLRLRAFLLAFFLVAMVLPAS
jgi:hypothetical protein